LEDELLRQNIPIKYGVNVFNPQGLPLLGGSEKAMSGEQRADPDVDLVSHPEQL
jgi:hypothetical protein